MKNIRVINSEKSCVIVNVDGIVFRSEEQKYIVNKSDDLPTYTI